MEASAPPRPRAALRSPDRLRSCGDAELVRLVRLGQESAFEELYERYHRGILSFCRHMLGSRDEGEDAVQHTFIGAYRDLRRSDKPIHLKAWLYTIARNRCLSVLRARREQVALDDVEPATEGLAAEVQRREDLQDMLRDLRRLPDAQREALVLAEIGALSHEEIAMALSVRKEKVKALVFQARESLMSSRLARETDCQEIQEQLAVLRGGSLRRSTLRRHLDDCLACQAFREEVRRQRTAMAILLPVVPTAGLKGAAIASAVGAGGIAAGGAGGTAAVGGAAAAGGASSGVAAKVLVGVALMGAGTGGSVVAVEELTRGPGGTAEALERPPDGAAATVVAGLRGYAKKTGAQRAADLRGSSTTPSGPARPNRGAGNEPRGGGGKQASAGSYAPGGAREPAGNDRRNRFGDKTGNKAPAGAGFGLAPAAAQPPGDPPSGSVPAEQKPDKGRPDHEHKGKHKGKDKDEEKGGKKDGLGDKQGPDGLQPPGIVDRPHGKGHGDEDDRHDGKHEPDDDDDRDLRGRHERDEDEDEDEDGDDDDDGGRKGPRAVIDEAGREAEAAAGAPHEEDGD